VYKHKIIFTIFIISLFLSLSYSYALSDKQQDIGQNKEEQLYDPSVIIIRFKDEVTTNQIEDFLKENNCKVRGQIKQRRIFYTVLLPEGITYDDVEEKFEKDKRVKYVSPDIYMEFGNSGIEFVNEIRQRSEEAFSSVGLYDEDNIDALDLLGDNDNNQKVIVAVLDSGISPQLQGILEELDMFIPGINIADGNNNIRDDDGHGTQMTSILAAIYPYVDILTIKTNFTLSNMLDAIEYAIDVADRENAKLVINCSFGMSRQVWIDAYNGDAEKADARLARYNEDFSRFAQEALIVGCAGNDDSTDVWYPSRFTNAISVGATHSDISIGTESNYGSFVNVYAPGDSSVFGKFGFWFDGYGKTSQAAVMVSALASLILVENPDLSYEEVTNIIKHVDATSSISTGRKSGRLINFFDAIEYTRENYVDVMADKENLLGLAIDPVVPIIGDVQAINQTPSLGLD